MNKYVKVIKFNKNGTNYRALIYINDNTVKYVQPHVSKQSDDDFMKHALKMIGWC